MGRLVAQFFPPTTNSPIRKTILKAARPWVAHKLTTDTGMCPAEVNQT